MDQIKRSKILIVDDDEQFLKSMDRILRKEPYEIYLVNSALSGLDRLKDVKMDLVISDHMMPEMLGTEFLSRVRTLYPDTWRIMVTGEASYLDAIKAVNEGEVYRIIAKPFDNDDFRATIRLALKHKISEEMIRNSEVRLRRLIATNADAIIVVDREGIIKFINSSAENLWRKKPSEFIGQQFGFVLTPGESTEIDIMRLKEEPGIGDMRVMEIKWENQPAFLVTIRDISDRKQMEEDLRQSVMDLEKANKKILKQQKALIEEERLKVLLQMAGATAHELNQPLMTLLGNIELLELIKDEPEKQAKSLDVIKEAGKRIADIVQKIQTIRHHDTKPYAGHTSIINIDQDINILSVEESDSDFLILSSNLENYKQVRLSRARSFDEAFRFLEKKSIDLIFLDYILPDGNGLDFLRTMKQKGIDLPAVVITGKGDESIASKMIQAGAYDYLPKADASDKTLSSVISNSMVKFRLKKEVNLTMQKMAEMSTRDELTGLYNRRYFNEALAREVSRARRYHTELTLCMMDLDHFKQVNDTYGHPVGDMVLKEISLILNNSRETDIPCRYGGEEFALILPHTDLNGATILNEKLRETVATRKFEHNGSDFTITVSIGIVPWDGTGNQSPDDFVALAD